MNTRLCLIDVTASHYRSEIYNKMANVFDIDFYFGNLMPSIKSLDTTNLRGFKKILETNKIGPWYFYKESQKLLAENYSHFILDGDFRCISTWVFLVRAKFTSKKTYLWTHGWYGRESFVKRFIKKMFFSLTDGVFVYGDYAKDLMVKNGVSENKLNVIHNSLAYDDQVKIRESLTKTDIFKKHFGNDHPTIIFIGRLTAIKRLDLLLDAILILKQKGELYNVIFVGDGIMKDDLQQKVGKNGLENIWFYGACYDERTNAELIYNSDLCVAPGNVGLTAMHTMVFGTPVISHDDFKRQMPEFGAIKAGVTGDFFAAGDVESLAATISKWFKFKKNSRVQVRIDCMKEIDDNWNPYFQIEVFKKVFNQ